MPHVLAGRFVALSFSFAILIMAEMVRVKSLLFVARDHLLVFAAGPAAVVTIAARLMSGSSTWLAALGFVAIVGAICCWAILFPPWLTVPVSPGSKRCPESPPMPCGACHLFGTRDIRRACYGPLFPFGREHADESRGRQNELR